MTDPRTVLVEVVAEALKTKSYDQFPVPRATLAVAALLAHPDEVLAALGLTTERWLHRIDGEYFDDDRGYTMIPEGDFIEEMAENAEEGAIEIVALVTLGTWRAVEPEETPR